MNISNLFSMQATILLLMGIGALIKKLGIVTENSKISLVDLVLYVALPGSIIKSFLIPMDIHIIRTCLIMLVVTLIIQFASLGIGELLFRKKEGDRRKIMQYGTICSNSGILGNAVAEGLFSHMGMLYASVGLVPIRAFMWGFGLSIFTEAPSKKALVKKVISHPCIIAVGIGFLLMLMQIHPPQILEKTLDSIANMSFPLAAISVGTILAGVDLKRLITRDTLVISVVRLGLIPGLVYIGCTHAHIPSIVTAISVIFACMPVANMTAILASKYRHDEKFASSCVVTTTIFSSFTIPLWCLLLI